MGKSKLRRTSGLHVPRQVIQGLIGELLTYRGGCENQRSSHFGGSMVTRSRVSDPGRFVGREAEFTELLEGLDGAVQGRGALFLIGGEPGIGKSRLIEELATRARKSGASVLWGGCWEAGGAPPFWPWIQAMRSYVRGKNPEALADEMGSGVSALAQMIPEIRDMFSDLPEPPSADPETARFRLFEAATSFLRSAAEIRPLVLILDDLHAADAPSLLLLRFVAREISGTPLLLVAAYRDTEVGLDLGSALADLRRERVTRRLSLTGLTGNNVERFIEATAGFVPSSELVSAIHVETDGNPLFVGEFIRLLAAEGRLTMPLDPAFWRPLLQQGVVDVISRRLEQISERSRGVLAQAAILGREFDLAVLERVSGLSRHSALQAVDEAAAAGVVKEIPDVLGRLRFAHALVRDVLYEEIPPANRIRLHREIGEMLEGLYADVEPHLSELAHHFFWAAPGGEFDKAIDYSKRAARCAVEALAYEEAVRLYRLALQVAKMKPPDSALTCELLLGLGDAQARAGDTAEAKNAFLAAAETARRGGMPECLVRAALGYGGRFVWETGRGDPHLIGLLEEALEIIGDEDSVLRARLLARLAGGPLRDDPDRERRARLSQQGVEMARRLGDVATLAYVLDGRCAAVWWPENVHERLAIATELIRAAEKAVDRERMLQGHNYRLLCFLELGERESAYKDLEAKTRLAEELRQPSQLFYLSAVEGMLAMLEGRFDEAETLIVKSVEQGRQAEESMTTIYQAVQMHALRKAQGRVDEVVDLVEEAARRFPAYFVLRCALADIYADLGRSSDALSLFRTLARDHFAELHRNEEWLYAMCLLANVATSVGETDSARELYEMLLPFAAVNAISAPEAYAGAVSRSLGILATSMGRWEEAQGHLHHALSMNEGMGAIPWVVCTKLNHAEMLLSRARDGDRASAIDLLRSALEIAKPMGMSTVAARCTELLRETGEDAAEPLRIVRTFMFTDIVGSTDLIEVIGDRGWTDLRRWQDRTLRALFREHRGEEIRHTGDGFFVAFNQPDRGIRCAQSIQRALRDHRLSHGFAPQVRIGLHSGEASAGDETYSGRAVHIAARVAALAEGGDIVVSRETLSSNLRDVNIRQERSVRLKGISELVSVVWLDS